MSDLTPIDDELVSAYLDDEVTDAERAAIEADENAMARVARLGEVRDAVAAPTPPLADTARERTLAAALAASETHEAVTSLAPARARRRREWLPSWSRERAWRPVVAIAAAILLLALAVPALTSLDLGGDSTDTAGEGAAESAADTDRAATSAQATQPDDPAAADIAELPEQAEMAASESGDDGSQPFEAAAEAPAEEAAAEPVDESSTAGAAGEADSAAGLPFEPLPVDLGDFGSMEELLALIEEEYAAWLADPEAALARSGGPDVVEPACTSELEIEAEEIAGGGYDISDASVDGEPHVVWLFASGQARLAPTGTCSPAVVAIFSGG